MFLVLVHDFVQLYLMNHLLHNKKTMGRSKSIVRLYDTFRKLFKSINYNSVQFSSCYFDFQT